MSNFAFHYKVQRDESEWYIKKIYGAKTDGLIFQQSISGVVEHKITDPICNK